MCSQLICLPWYIDTATAGQITYTWAVLSSACHYHLYELAPTAAELTSWIGDVAELLAAIAAAVPSRQGLELTLQVSKAIRNPVGRSGLLRAGGHQFPRLVGAGLTFLTQRAQCVGDFIHLLNTVLERPTGLPGGGVDNRRAEGSRQPRWSRYLTDRQPWPSSGPLAGDLRILDRGYAGPAWRRLTFSYGASLHRRDTP